MTAPLNISSDDAAFFTLSSNVDADAGSDDDDTEDPTGGPLGSSSIGQLDMYKVPKPKQRHLARGGSGEPTTMLNLTKGANLIPH